jgi:hypothetical protein
MHRLLGFCLIICRSFLAAIYLGTPSFLNFCFPQQTFAKGFFFSSSLIFCLYSNLGFVQSLPLFESNYSGKLQEKKKLLRGDGLPVHFTEKKKKKMEMEKVGVMVEMR